VKVDDSAQEAVHTQQFELLLDLLRKSRRAASNPDGHDEEVHLVD
jgi:hypothetical protein